MNLQDNIEQEDINKLERMGYQIMEIPLEKRRDFENDFNRALIDLARYSFTKCL